RDGLRAYLQRFAFANATWLDLVDVLDARADFDVAEWSRAWVEEAGRPSIRTELEQGADGMVERIALVQRDPLPDRNLLWAQRIGVLVDSASGVEVVPIDLDGERAELAVAAPADVELVLPPADGLAYGAFELDPASRNYLLERLPEIEDPVARGAAWITLWEEMLGGRVPPTRLVTLALSALPR